MQNSGFLGGRILRGPAAGFVHSRLRRKTVPPVPKVPGEMLGPGAAVKGTGASATAPGHPVPKAPGRVSDPGAVAKESGALTTGLVRPVPKGNGVLTTGPGLPVPKEHGEILGPGTLVVGEIGGLGRPEARRYTKARA